MTNIWVTDEINSLRRDLIKYSNDFWYSNINSSYNTSFLFHVYGPTNGQSVLPWVKGLPLDNLPMLKFVYL